MDLGVTHLYHVECFDKDGNLKWEDGFKNIVVTVGRNYYLDAAIKTGVASPTWFVGLKNATAAVAADTMSSKGFTELVPYSDATRPSYVTGTIASGSVDNSASKAVFNINGASTIGGAFLVNNNTKGGTTGTLLGAGNFAVARAVEIGDVLNVTVTCSITSV